MIYKQTRPMQWITFYYNGDDKEKMKQTKERNLQMKKRIRYANAIEEARDEQLEVISDTENHFVGMTNDGLIVMYENQYRGKGDYIYK